MKKIFAVILALLMIFTVGCSGNSSEKLTPYDNLPDFNKDFKVVFKYVDSSAVSEEKINEIMGYLVSAYKADNAETACEYIYKQNYSEAFSEMYEAISTKASNCLTSAVKDERAAAAKLTSEALNITKANISYSQWLTKYTHEKTLSKSNFKTVQSSLKTAINALADVFYGKDIV